jgi:hypothetical protein
MFIFEKTALDSSATPPGNLRILLSLILFFPAKDGDIPCLSQAPERDKSHLFWSGHAHEPKDFSQSNLSGLDQLEASLS